VIVLALLAKYFRPRCTHPGCGHHRLRHHRGDLRDRKASAQPLIEFTSECSKGTGEPKKSSPIDIHGRRRIDSLSAHQSSLPKGSSMISPIRTKFLVAGLAAAAAVAFVSTGASALSAADGVRAGDVVSSGEPGPPPPTANPTALPTSPPTTAPTIPPLPTPTPSDEQCPIEPFIATKIALRSRVMTGPVTCEDIHSNITVSWDGAKIKIVIKPVDDFASGGKCELVKASVKAVQPNNAVVKDDGSVEVPYDKDKKEKITIKIE
jgi:hypothetical protein